MPALRILHTNMHRQWGGQPNRVLTTAIELRNLGQGPPYRLIAEQTEAVYRKVLAHR